MTSTNRPIVRLTHVHKTFAARTVVDRLSFEIRTGEIYALLGPNGAGKTTTVRMLVGIIQPDAGEIEVCLDGVASRRLPPRRIGYLPEDRGLYRDVTVRRNLEYFAMLRGLSRREAAASTDRWLARVGLMDRAAERVDVLSKGNQQRLQFVAAIMHQPALAILDEPFSGLDPVSQEFFLDLVRELRDAGTTVLLSAHQMDLVERVADRVLLMNRGREILSGTRSELLAQAENARLHDVFIAAVRDDDARVERGAA